mmetsp:Transcript_18534/g.49088  ORF Transcript_18534/g.49088 Transcript_18534/m.49088 type:complete len:110 (+) Transcript_18534:202-531(+)
MSFWARMKGPPALDSYCKNPHVAFSTFRDGKNLRTLNKLPRKVIQQLADFLAGPVTSSVMRKRLRCCLLRLVGAQLIARSCPATLSSLSTPLGFRVEPVSPVGFSAVAS